MPNKYLFTAGDRFGRWVVVTGESVYKTRRQIECRCDCGTVKNVDVSHLVYGRSKGCIHCFTRPISEGGKSNPFKAERKIWGGMWDRCKRTEGNAWRVYGEKGITVCERWKSFDVFLQDMGPRPSPKHSIDRIDGSLGYSPENCRWADPYEQQNNRCNNRIIEYNGESLTIAQWCRKLNLNRDTLVDRLERMPVDEAFTRPIDIRKSRSRKNTEASHVRL